MTLCRAIGRWVAICPTTQWAAGSYSLVLVLDNREVREKRDRQYIQECLAQNNIALETRPLPVGDVLWLLRPLGQAGPSDDDIVAGSIIERKRMDDLLSSLKDGRLREQRVRGSGLGREGRWVGEWVGGRAGLGPGHGAGAWGQGWGPVLGAGAWGWGSGLGVGAGGLGLGLAKCSPCPCPVALALSPSPRRPCPVSLSTSPLPCRPLHAPSPPCLSPSSDCPHAAPIA